MLSLGRGCRGDVNRSEAVPTGADYRSHPCFVFGVDVDIVDT